MKYALLVSRTLSNGTASGTKNIGDYIQSLAASQFMPRIDEYYDKTNDDYGSDPIKMIMNAWYILNPDKFPLSPRIIPLLTSIHISPSCSEKLLSLDKVVSWFKINEPIGCRDKATTELLLSKGIKAYFSGCLTLTLGMNYKHLGDREGIIFVDPYIPHLIKELSILDYIKISIFAFRHLYSCVKISKKFEHLYCNGKLLNIKKILYTAVFLYIYSSIFSFQDLYEAQYVSHVVKVGEDTNLITEEEKLKYAEILVKQYASSKLVITRRIHCALPCLGLETPVIFTTGKAIEANSPVTSAGRFEGLINLLNIMRVNKLTINKSPSFPIINKSEYRIYADQLRKQCIAFMSESSDRQ